MSLFSCLIQKSLNEKLVELILHLILRLYLLGFDILVIRIDT